MGDPMDKIDRGISNEAFDEIVDEVQRQQKREIILNLLEEVREWKEKRAAGTKGIGASCNKSSECARGANGEETICSLRTDPPRCRIFDVSDGED